MYDRTKGSFLTITLLSMTALSLLWATGVVAGSGTPPVEVQADLEVDGWVTAEAIQLTDSTVTSSYEGNSAGSYQEKISIDCRDLGSSGLMVGLRVKRYWNDDGDRDRYTFSVICR